MNFKMNNFFNVLQVCTQNVIIQDNDTFLTKCKTIAGDFVKFSTLCEVGCILI